MKAARRVLMGGLFLTASAGATLGYWAGRAQAAGPPIINALTYAGMLTDLNGTPLSGSRNIQIQIWDQADGGVSQCGTNASAQNLVGGSFQVALPDACRTAVHAHSDLWAEVFVDSTSLGRVKLGAVPYALEAAQASDATGALRATLTTLDNASVKVAGDQTIAGGKTFTGVVTLPCPQGMTDSGAGYCIDAADRIETEYASSVATCAGEGKMVCSFRELCTARARNVADLGTATYRVSDLMFFAPNGAHYLGGGSGGNSLQMPAACASLVAPGPNGDAMTYRCCRGKG